MLLIFGWLPISTSTRTWIWAALWTSLTFLSFCDRCALLSSYQYYDYEETALKTSSVQEEEALKLERGGQFCAFCAHQSLNLYAIQNIYVVLQDTIRQLNKLHQFSVIAISGCTDGFSQYVV